MALPKASPPADGAAQRDERYQVRVRGLKKRFGDKVVLDGAELDIERGKINFLIGGSGQGKSVMTKLLIGLIKPDEGHIYVDGEDTVPMNDTRLNELRRKFGMNFQYSALFDSLTVEENIGFPLAEHTKKSKEEIRAIVHEMLDKLDLGRIEKRYAAELSGGMRKRVGLARSLVLQPEILLYDEPTTGLDPVACKNVDEMIADTARTFGVTSFVISHDMASVFRIGDRISMLYQGKILISGTRSEILGSDNDVLRTFVETSGAVRFDRPESQPSGERGRVA
jgi:phospholipid/cholesterol/gamma-HCH transport system ATP-binding protein